MYIEMVDETGQVSEGILQQTQEILEFAAQKIGKDVYKRQCRWCRRAWLVQPNGGQGHRSGTRWCSDFNFNKSKITKIIRRQIMSKFNRIHLVVLDSVGIGAAPDANNFVNADVYKRQDETS